MDGPMFTCGSEGIYSVVALVPAGLFMDPEKGVKSTDPVLVHVTVCPEHLRAARAFLRVEGGSDADIQTMRTDLLLEHWDQLIEPVGVPVYGYMAAVS